MNLNYHSSMRRASQPIVISLPLKAKRLNLMFLFLLLFSFLKGQVIISEVFANGAFELKNMGDEEVDISSYVICDYPIYINLPDLTLECGSLKLGAGKTVVLSSTELDDPTDSELGLYLSRSFTDPSQLLSYVEWGTSTHMRSSVAVQKGIWDGNLAPSFNNNQSLKRSGDGTKAADWTINTNPQKCVLPPPPPSTSSARYKVTFDAVWSSTTHPTDFPSNAHFSGLVGMTHTDNVALFELGTIASNGIVIMAETGGKNTLVSEIQAVINAGQAKTTISGGGIGSSPGMVSVEFDMENSHPLASVTTMIAPSPDWFVGVRNVNLFENGSWLANKEVQVGVYDAGSDSGVTFTSSNSATTPRDSIKMITDGPLVVNGMIPSMGTMTFVRIDTICNAVGGTLAGGPFTFCVDGTADHIPADGITLSGNTGSNSQWVVTDTEGKILGLPPSFTGPNFDAAGAGVCFVWHLSYEDGLMGLAMDGNINNITGCFDLSNSVQVTRNNPTGGTLVGGPFTFCVDGTADNIPADGITLSGNTGANSQWVVTDEAGKILGLPPSFTGPDFDAAGAGVCFVYHLSYEDGLTGLAMDGNINNLTGCFDLSNSIQVTRNQPDGGTLAGGPFKFCVDGTADHIPVDGITLSGNTGSKTQWVVTDPDGKILGLPPSFTGPNFDAAGEGVCFVYHLSYEDSLMGLAMDGNINNLTGCYDLSNSVQVTREDCNTCTVAGGTLAGGPFTFCVDGTADNIPADAISLSGNTGANSQWVVTDEAGKILGLPPSFTGPDFDAAGEGVCFVYHLSYEDGLTGLAMDGNINNLTGCFDLSNSIQVTRNQPDGGTLAGGPFKFCVDGTADHIPADGITLSGNTGSKTQWVVTDPDGKILGLPPSFTGPNFDAAGEGVCFVYHLSYEDSLMGLAMDGNINNLTGCYDLSNSIQVTREDCNTCTVAGGTLAGGPFTFCVDGTADNIPADGISLSGNTGANSQWVVTDEAGKILGLPPSFTGPNFDAAGEGVCFVYHLSYEDGLTGLAMDSSINNFTGCYSLSNSIQVTRTETKGGILAGGPFTFCVGDGEADHIEQGAITLSEQKGALSQWVVTDLEGMILGLPPMPAAVNFDGAGDGTCYIRHLSYEEGLTGLSMGNNISDLVGCHNLSNSITVNRNTGGDCESNASKCAPPSDIKVDVISSRKIRIDWENVPDAQRYVIEIRFAGSTKIAGRGKIRFSRVHVFAPAGRDYEFRLQTLCADGSESDFTEWLTFSTPSNLVNAIAESRNKETFKADLVIENRFNEEFKVFPNPVQHVLYLQYRSNNTAKVSLYHISGQKVLEQTLTKNTLQHQINISDLEDGFYLISIEENGKNAVNKRIIKNNK